MTRAVTDADAVATALAVAALTCTHCGSDIERGYLVVEGDEPLRETAVCDTCGWGEVGHAGCAPELRDFDRGDALVRVDPGDDEPTVTVTDA